MTNTAPSRADPVVVFPLADGAHHKKPHSPTHPRSLVKSNLKYQIVDYQTSFKMDEEIL